MTLLRLDYLVYYHDNCVDDTSTRTGLSLLLSIPMKVHIDGRLFVIFLDYFYYLRLLYYQNLLVISLQ